MTPFLSGVLVTLSAGVLVGVAFADSSATAEVTVRMPKEKVEECSRVGGCAFLTPAEVMWAHQKGAEEGVKAYKEDHVDFHGCTKDDA